MNKNCIIQLLIVLALISGMACHHKASPAATASQPGKVLFLSYEAVRDPESDKVSLKTTQQNLTSGSITAGYPLDADDKAGNWQISITDKNNKPIETVRIENPFHTIVEYVGEDGSSGTREIMFLQTDFSIRVNYSNVMKTVTIEEIGTDQQRNLLFKHSLVPTGN